MSGGRLFAAEGLRGYELGEADLEELQRVLERAPAYAELADGEPVRPDAARGLLASLPPPGWPYTRRWLIGLRDADAVLVAIADVVSDLLAAQVWHIGLFLLPEPLHGSGLAQRAYALLEDWMRAGGARWSRLGVIEGNARAERFWRRAGYEPLRTRRAARGREGNRVIVMAKPLARGTLAEYLALVPRDRPASG